MRHKHALSIALAGFAATIALGAGMAGADPVAGLGDGAAVTPSATTAAPNPQAAPQLPECGDGVDNDGDALIDLDDPGCQAEGGSEAAAAGPAPDEAQAPEGHSGKGETLGGTGIGANQPAPESTRNPKVVQQETIGASDGPDTGGVGTPRKVQEGDELKAPSAFTDGGSPTRANPSATIAPFGPAPIGVPNVVIDSFEIPPFLLPIYQACGTQYGIPWNVLASINKIETGFGTNLNVSSAGAMGWMQFIPSSWEAYGVDANGDGRKDPYNPVDAICAAARYLEAAGGTEDLYEAIFAYNHADWYVQEVLLYARAYGKLPTDLIGSLTGLTEGAHFPVAADARYADDISTREALKRATPSARSAYGNAAEVISSSPTRRGINIFSRKGAPIVAVNDGVIKRIGHSEKLGRHIVLQDAYGNRYVYARLGRIARSHPVPKPRKLTAEDFELVSPKADEAPREPATVAAREEGDGGQQAGGKGKKRLPRFETFEKAFNSIFAFDSETTERRSLEVGSKVVGGTVIGRMAGSIDGVDPHINFSIRPAGRGAPKIDPKPILDGWKLLEATAIYRAVGKNPFRGDLGVGGVLLMSKQALIRRLLADPRLEVYSCGRTDIRTGQLDRRLLATLAYLSEQGFRLSITSLLCGRHGSITTSGNVSNHSYGNAVDIAAINGVPVLGNQGPGSLTEALLKSVLRLQGTLRPTELISLHELGGPSFAMGDHADHVHIGWRPPHLDGKLAKRFVQLLKPDQWERLIDRLGEIENPEVPTRPSKAALPADDREHGSHGHAGE